MTPRDVFKAAKAYTELGRCYLEGIGVAADKKKAAKGSHPVMLLNEK